jgi:hypothetical protein
MPFKWLALDRPTIDRGLDVKKFLLCSDEIVFFYNRMSIRIERGKQLLGLTLKFKRAI